MKTYSECTTVHELLRVARVTARLTHAELAVKSGISVGSIYRWEGGSLTPSLVHYRFICDLLDVPTREAERFVGLMRARGNRSRTMKAAMDAFYLGESATGPPAAVALRPSNVPTSRALTIERMLADLALLADTNAMTFADVEDYLRQAPLDADQRLTLVQILMAQR